MMAEMPRCLFCGDEMCGMTSAINGGEHYSAYLYCGGCDAQGPGSGCWHDNPDDAIEDATERYWSMLASRQPRKVWVLVEDDYHYSIVGIYNSRENAERVKAERQNPDDTIAEWDLDDRLDWRRRRRFRVWLDRSGVPFERDDEFDWASSEDSGRAIVHRGYGSDGWFAVGISCESHEDAIRLAREAIEREKQDA